VRVQVEADWLRAETETRLLAKAETMAAQIGEGKTFQGLGLSPSTQRGQTRSGFLPGLPADALERVFTLTAQDVVALPHNGAAILLRLDTINAPDLESDESKLILNAVEEQGSNGLSSDLYQALARDIQSRTDVAIDERAVNAVHANFQ
jgi:peptidyl-prolyl cis-trans isomerase D